MEMESFWGFVDGLSQTELLALMDAMGRTSANRDSLKRENMFLLFKSSRGKTKALERTGLMNDYVTKEIMSWHYRNDIKDVYKMPEIPFDDAVLRDSCADKYVGIAGVYFAFEGQVCIYVGESGNVAKRLRSHNKVSPSHMVCVIEYDQPEDRFFAECFYIWMMRPILNSEGQKSLGGIKHDSARSILEIRKITMSAASALVGKKKKTNVREYWVGQNGLDTVETIFIRLMDYETRRVVDLARQTVMSNEQKKTNSFSHFQMKLKHLYEKVFPGMFARSCIEAGIAPDAYPSVLEHLNRAYLQLIELSEACSVSDFMFSVESLADTWVTNKELALLTQT